MHKNKPTTLYAHPFTKEYWRVAASELKDVHMLALAALLTALRIATKGIYIPIAPNLNFNIISPLMTALGGMIFGPIIAIPAGFISDTIGYMLFPQGAYFLPCCLTEIASTMIFGMYFYRAKISTTRVILARFSIDLFVNIILNSVIMFWYYKVLLGKSYAAMVLPAAIKNLCFFPIECLLLLVFFRVLIPVTQRMNLTYDHSEEAKALKFDAKQGILLATLFCVAAVSMGSYLVYYYNHNSLSAGYTAEQRYEANTQMTEHLLNSDMTGWDDVQLVTTVESAYKKFLGSEITYDVAVYSVNEEALEGYSSDLETIRGMSKSKAKAVAKDGIMEYLGNVTIVVNEKTNEVLSISQ